MKYVWWIGWNILILSFIYTFILSSGLLPLRIIFGFITLVTWLATSIVYFKMIHLPKGKRLHL